MKLDESSIFITLCRLRKKLYSCQFMMDKAARVIYGTPLMQHCGETLANFVLSYEVKEDRDYYIRKMYGEWMVTKTDFTFMLDENLIHFPVRQLKNGEENTPEHRTNSVKLDICRMIAKIDEDMGKWMQARKSKSISA